MISDIKQIQSKLNTIQKQIAKLEQQAHKESSKLITKGFKALFKKHPDLKSFSWNQYTPYFNDGDECVFGAYTDHVSINGSDEAESTYEVRRFLDTLHNPKKAINKLQKQIEEQKKEKYSYDYLEEQIKAIENGSIEETRNKLAILEDIDQILCTVNNDTYKEIFGDHVTVTVTKDGWTTESYEHD
jgi:predicted  nucleic acid-binding Zn-ribbon protein